AIIWGKDLAEAKKRGVGYLDELTLSGADGAGQELKSNVRFLRDKTATILQF
ncbi:MAG TPA: acetyl-CoA carboxylase biotin carboxylase subunit, partial [Desulfovibrio sp.]|nr:acetyl-CoA carboxylase biotin carboxylase subunit [Desulfovibrio sp.]